MKTLISAFLLFTACLTNSPGQGLNPGNNPPHISNPIGVAWGFTYGYPPDPPVEFIPKLREWGIGYTKVYLFWHQLEPVNDQFEWEALDALMYSKHKLVEYEQGMFTKEFPQARTFAILKKYLGDFTDIRRIQIREAPLLYLFEISKENGNTCMVAWEKRDSFNGEDDPPVNYNISWNRGKATALDLFGQTIPLKISQNNLSLKLSLDPVFIECIPE